MPNQPNKWTRISAALFLLLSGGLLQSGCHTPTPEEKGKKLADKYCSGCHLPVSPDLLDKDTWTRHVLPAMALKLGIRVWSGNHYYPPMPGEKPALISIKEWTELVAYYQTQAPEKLLPAKPPVPLQHDWSIFSMQTPVMKDSLEPAATTMVAFLPDGSGLLTSDGNNNTLTRWNRDRQVLNTWKLPSPAVNVLFTKDSTGQQSGILTEIGNMRAVDVSAGIVTRLSLDNPHSQQKDLMPFLKRPVQTLTADFDKDGLEDMLVCAFGHNQGGLYWLKQLPDHTFKNLPIWEVPGALQAITGDFNRDGYTDIMALFAAGDEGIWLFENDRKGGFTSRNLLRFPPLYGSTSFQLTDFNGDGQPDILYTCGDNADFSMVLKPYHGLYVYLNEGNNKYRETWHYPVNGCTKAVAADFNHDGKMDIAAIAFFADFQNNPAEKFIFFEGGNKPLSFTPHAPPIEKEGRWICMDVKDSDGDGDLDIVLGNYARGFIILDDYKADWKEYQPFIVLLNNSKR
ncbi:VCBS repeat-containing protein [Chitinophaga polysaccharea]|uniref:FG-GAP-like repeat-containing protein n=1 Tax=Chitinophaga TaxID=79328 RepID=UPI001455CAD1|nr:MULTISPECIES: FG-GAP-like repeat-containing protein [Chitinophaga]NLR56467.1 VCBS repeat-containing protein [Chitinophaga polysaccharea]NLU92698.1 VCBS repeat-containing protein [Chitinophaga sp. Ak27]